jgi:hypothetical protein
MRAWAPALLLAFLVLAAPARAYRPFDGTDATVADPGETEIELGPVGYLRQGSAHTLVAPALICNYGVAPGWEAVLQSEAVYGLSSGSGGAGLAADIASLKAVLREGALQDKPGPSIATEFDLLLPGINFQPGTGGDIDVILSQQWRWLTVHLNLLGGITQQQHGDAALDTILEGPRVWPVRPVSEIILERDFGGVDTRSILIGAIWQLRDSLALDAALRGARIGGTSLGEVRAGVTFAF